MSADIFSLCVVILELLTGTCLFKPLDEKLYELTESDANERKIAIEFTNFKQKYSQNNFVREMLNLIDGVELKMLSYSNFAKFLRLKESKFKHKFHYNNKIKIEAMK